MYYCDNLFFLYFAVTSLFEDERALLLSFIILYISPHWFLRFFLLLFKVIAVILYLVLVRERSIYWYNVEFF